MPSKQTILSVAKWTAKMAVNSGCSKVVHDVIDANVTADTTFEKVQVWIGSVALGMAAGTAAWNNLESMATESADRAKESKKLNDIVTPENE